MKKRNSPAYQKLTEVLRNAVLQGELKPGERLKIDVLAAPLQDERHARTAGIAGSGK